MNIRNLAKICGVSRTTVSLALRNDPRISSYLRRKIQETARQVGYHPDPKVAELLTRLARGGTESAAVPLAIVSPWPHRREWDYNWLLNQFHGGIQKRARELGYRAEDFWLSEPGMNDARMHDILRARGIEGVIIFNYIDAPAHLTFEIAPFASVVLGRAVVSPRFPSVDHDHFQGMVLALEQLSGRGYRRIGFVITDECQSRARSVHQWEAGYQIFQQSRPRAQRLPALVMPKTNPAKLGSWLRRHRPDAVIGTDVETKDMLEAVGVRIPQQTAFATLVWRGPSDKCAGVDIQCAGIGACAVDIVTEQLHRHEQGVNRWGRTILVDGVWRDGESARATLG